MADPIPATAEPDSGSGSTYALDDAALMARARRLYRENIGTVEKWRDNADEDEAFPDGHQWTSEEIADLKEQNRPVIVFNRISKVIDVIVGLEINNREDITAKPRSDDDGQACEVVTDLIEWVRDACEAEHEETDAFRDSVVTGMGWVEVRSDELLGEARLIQARVNNRDMIWPTSVSSRNLEDARWLMRCREMDLDEAEEIHPDANPEDLHASWATDSSDEREQHSSSPLSSYRDSWSKGGKLPKRVTVVEYCWREVDSYQTAMVPKVGPDGQPAVDENGQPTGEMEEQELPSDLPEEQMAILLEQMAKSGVQPETKKRPCVYTAHLGGTVLYREKLPAREDLPYRAITGKYDRKDKVFYGVVRHAKDPQRWANKWRLQGLHILNTNAKNTLLHERGTFENDEDAKRDLAQPGAVVAVEPGAISGGRLMWRDSPGFQAGFDAMMAQADDAIPACMGVNAELMGAQDREQAGVLEYQRKQASVTVLATFFDNLKRARKTIGRLLWRYLQAGYLPKEDLIHVIGKDRAAALELALAPDALRLDIVVDESPSSPNAKERNWAMMQPLLPTILGMDMPPEAKLEIFKSSPVPASVFDRVKVIIEQAQPQQQEQQEKQQAMMEAAATAKVELDQARAILTQAQAQQLGLGAEQAGVETAFTGAKTAKTAAETAKIKAETGISVAEAAMDAFERPQHAAQEREDVAADRHDRREDASTKADIARGKMNGATNGPNGAANGPNGPTSLALPARPFPEPMMAPPLPSSMLGPLRPPEPPAYAQPPTQPQNAAAIAELVQAIRQMTQMSAAMAETASRPRRYVRDEGGQLIGSEVV